MKLIAIIAVIAMATAMVATIPVSAEDEINRVENVGPFFFGFLEDDGELIFGANRAFTTLGTLAFDGPADEPVEGAIVVTLTGDDGVAMTMSNAIINPHIPFLGTALWTAGDKTLLFAGAVTGDGTIDGEIWKTLIANDVIGVVNLKGAIYYNENEEDFGPLEFDVTVTNRSEEIEDPTTPTEDPTTPTEDPTTPTDEPSGPPNSGVVLAIIPTLIAAGAAIVVSKKRK
jgi:hypothetical protein